MKESNSPKPDVMPVDRGAWYQELHLSNFINTSCQLDDVRSCPGVRKILEVGSGQGLSTKVLRWKDFDVSTFDIDETFQPDYVGSVHDMSCFGDRQFDMVIASHVLEHLPLPLLDPALREIARVARYALVYVPVAGTHHFQLRLFPGFHGFDFTFFQDVYRFWEKPSGTDPRYCQGQHYWEVGYRGFRVRDLVARFSGCFKVIRHYRNRDWNVSYNFVLESRSAAS